MESDVYSFDIRAVLKSKDSQGLATSCEPANACGTSRLATLAGLAASKSSSEIAQVFVKTYGISKELWIEFFSWCQKSFRNGTSDTFLDDCEDEVRLAWLRAQGRESASFIFLEDGYPERALTEEEEQRAIDFVRRRSQSKAEASLRPYDEREKQTASNGTCNSVLSP